MTNNVKDWLVMLYLSGDNDLSEESVWALTEILRAGRGERVSVVVQIDPRAGGIRRFDVNRLFENLPHAKSVDLRTRDLLSRGVELENEDMASIDTLRSFIVDSRQTHRAYKHMLILSGHSGGPTGKGFLIDLFPQQGLSLDEVREAIEGTGKLDIIGIDSCGMGMAEVAFQMRDCASFLVASEGFELNTGWPYFSILDELNRRPEIEPQDLAARIVDIHTQYYASYEMAGVSTDMSACDLIKVSELSEAIKSLAFELTKRLMLQKQFSHQKDSVRDQRIFVEDLPLEARSVADAIILAHWRAQSYRFERHTDLVDFCKLLYDGCNDAAIRGACSNVISIVTGTAKSEEKGKKDDAGYVVRSCHSGRAFQHSNGVAVFFPWASFDESYSELAFSIETGWNLFLRTYLRTTRRRAREDEGIVKLVARPADELTKDDFPKLDASEFPNFEIKDFPELGTKDFPELGTKDFPELGTKDFPELGTKDFPELGTKGKLLVPIMKNGPDIFFKDKC
jgi:Clostripain family